MGQDTGPAISVLLFVTIENIKYPTEYHKLPLFPALATSDFVALRHASLVETTNFFIHHLKKLRWNVFLVFSSRCMDALECHIKDVSIYLFQFHEFGPLSHRKQQTVSILQKCYKLNLFQHHTPMKPSFKCDQKHRLCQILLEDRANVRNRERSVKNVSIDSSGKV